MRIKVVLSYIGSLLQILGGIFLFPIFIGLYYKETFMTSLYGYVMASFISLTLGYLISATIAFKKPELKEAMVICTVAWLIIPLFSVIPYIYATPLSPLDAFFESVSGFTTTGITLIENISSLPRSILFWRAMTQWLGGLGILTFFLAVVVEGSASAFHLFSAEAHKITTGRPSPGLFSTIRILWKIYIVLTVLEIMVLYLAGVPLYESIVHTFTTVSTGGFSIFDGSIAAYNNAMVEIIVLFFMFCGGTNFLLIYSLFEGDIISVVKNYEFRLYIFIIALVTGLICYDVAVHGVLVDNAPVFIEKGENLTDTLFQVLAIITTTGFETRSIMQFPNFSKILFLFLMFVGGCVGSTAGGFKVLRLGVMWKLARREQYRMQQPFAVSPVVISSSIVEPRELSKIASLFFLFIGLVFVGGAITAFYTSLGPIEALSCMFSAVGNVGPCFITVPQMISMPVIVKITFIVGMLAGRLEILPLLLLFSRKTWKSFP